LSLRVSDTLHNALESLRRQRAQEEKRDYSLSEIVEENLWQTLKLDRRIAERFHGEENAQLFLIIAQRIAAIQTATGDQNQHWLDNPFLYKQVRQMIDAVLDALSPAGDRETLPPIARNWPPALQEHVKNIGEREALNAMAFLRAASEEKAPALLPAVLYHKAAATLGKRLIESNPTEGGK
jgi:hypothetical protein